MNSRLIKVIINSNYPNGYRLRMSSNTEETKLKHEVNNSIQNFSSNCYMIDIYEDLGLHYNARSRKPVWTKYDAGA